MFVDDILLAIGGLSFFLIGLNILKNCFYNLSKSKVNLLITRFTKTNLRAFLVGILATLIVQSSSSVTAIVIMLIATNILSLTKGLLVIIGANVGTCFTAYLFTFNISNYSFLIVFVSVIFSFFKNTKLKTIGEFLLSLGLIFTGLNFLELGLTSISETAIFNVALIKFTSNNFSGLITSTILTALIQSSSIIIVITQELYSLETFNLTQAVVIMLGANIGTCITGIIAAINGNTTARQAAFANLIFNVLGALLFIIIINPFVLGLKILENNYFLINKRLTITTAHTIFNIISAVLGFIFINQLVRLVTLNFKKKIDKSQLNDIIRLSK